MEEIYQRIVGENTTVVGDSQQRTNEVRTVVLNPKTGPINQELTRIFNEQSIYIEREYAVNTEYDGVRREYNIPDIVNGEYQVCNWINNDGIEFNYNIFFGIYNPNDFPVTIHTVEGDHALYDDVTIPPHSYSSLTNDYPMLLVYLKYHEIKFTILETPELPTTGIFLSLRYGNFDSADFVMSHMADGFMLGLGCVMIMGNMILRPMFGEELPLISSNVVEDILWNDRQDHPKYKEMKNEFKRLLTSDFIVPVMIEKVGFYNNTIK